MCSVLFRVIPAAIRAAEFRARLVDGVVRQMHAGIVDIGGRWWLIELGAHPHKTLLSGRSERGKEYSIRPPCPMVHLPR